MMLLACEPATLAEIAPFIQNALKFDTTNGATSLADFDGGKALRFKITTDDGEIIGGYTLCTVTLATSKIAWIETAAGNLHGLRLFDLILPAIRMQARALGATHLHMVTCRRGLVEKMEKNGFQCLGVVMGEKL